jgi:hypothetical protein
MPRGQAASLISRPKGAISTASGPGLLARHRRQVPRLHPLLSTPSRDRRKPYRPGPACRRLSASVRQSPWQSARVRHAGNDVTQITLSSAWRGPQARDGGRSHAHGEVIAGVCPAVLAVLRLAIPRRLRGCIAESGLIHIKRRRCAAPGPASAAGSALGGPPVARRAACRYGAHIKCSPHAAVAARTRLGVSVSGSPAVATRRAVAVARDHWRPCTRPCRFRVA